MAVYVTKRCGNCGTITQPRHRDDEGFKIGNPISRCYNCGTILIDTSKKEFIMFKPIDYVKYFIWKILVGWLIGFLVGGLTMLLIDNVTLLWIICIIIMILWFMLALKQFNEEKLDSIKRTKKYEYLNELYLTKCITKKQMDDFIELYNVEIPKKETKKAKESNIDDEYTVEDMAGGIIEYALKQVNDMEPIFKINNISFNFNDYTISTFAYLFGIFYAYACKKMSKAKCNRIDKFFINKFTEINTDAYKDENKREEKLLFFKTHYEKAKNEAIESIKEDGSFVDTGITDMYLISFLKNEDADVVKLNVLTHILKKWVIPFDEILKQYDAK